jgi:hypothetical protein
VEKNRGRIETRTVTTTTATIDERHLDWPGAKQLIRLERHTVEKGQTRPPQADLRDDQPATCQSRRPPQADRRRTCGGLPAWAAATSRTVASTCSTRSSVMMPAASARVMRLALSTAFASQPSTFCLPTGTAPADSLKLSGLSAENTPSNLTS